MAGTIYSFTVTNATTAVGTYNVTGGTAECTRAMATGGSNEVTIGSQTFYKFNTSTEWNFTLVGNTLAVGDVITFTCACHATSNKSGKGLIANGVTKTNDFPANTTNTLVYTVAAGDAFDGKTVINVKRADSDIKFGTIEITRGAAVAVTGVTLNKNTTSIEAGHTEQLTATVTPLEATTQTVSWSSSNTAVASVDNNGLVTANSEGTDTITVTTTDGSFTASCIVTVTPSTTPTVDVTGVNLSKYATSLEVGEQETLTATVLPAGATNKAVTWSSSDNTIATVSNGVVTAVAPGTASITVTTEMATIQLLVRWQ